MPYQTLTAAPRTGFGLLSVVYLVVGGIVSATHDYWANLEGLKQVVSALLALLLWPLLLVGIDLHVR